MYALLENVSYIKSNYIYTYISTNIHTLPIFQIFQKCSYS